MWEIRVNVVEHWIEEPGAERRGTLGRPGWIRDVPYASVRIFNQKSLVPPINPAAGLAPPPTPTVWRRHAPPAILRFPPQPSPSIPPGPYLCVDILFSDSAVSPAEGPPASSESLLPQIALAPTAAFCRITADPPSRPRNHQAKHFFS
ncbi:hypothetical protein PGTUg99_015706 [Puccinia graminis f. sp. tritici]|uniref:Uncharacterized protein n=1 Tax=Puccinia graminis f. sp. tritici TaxID=56615 RepID=A0A5B0SJ52_PUCGR|nr:hypothetical protein PGTUg99_015706 [Puccinia graminis f. sp. tritici]